MSDVKIIDHWNGLKKGDPIKLVKDVFHRMDGTKYGGIYYEPPGKIIAHRDSVGTFSGKTEKGILVYIRNRVDGVLGLVLDESCIEKLKLNYSWR